MTEPGAPRSGEPSPTGRLAPDVPLVLTSHARSRPLCAEVVVDRTANVHGPHIVNVHAPCQADLRES